MLFNCVAGAGKIIFRMKMLQEAADCVGKFMAAFLLNDMHQSSLHLGVLIIQSRGQLVILLGSSRSNNFHQPVLLTQ